ncbi:hypothetical protein F2Q69_00023304 [Brassica cretica]|uniref:Uncharacterized protein n=1 Tax=Brassica cretica TaxID=69181 RepID=A0A8S9Q786_BRACR|nr:hypothetical protein F2Q69_00023304 [Brassica cretica]
MVCTAGNTMLTSVARCDAGITYESLLVPAGSRSQPGITFLQSLEVLKQGTTSFGRVYNFDKLPKLEEPEEEFLEILQAYQITTKSRSAKGTLPKRREHYCSTSCKGARENTNPTSRSAGLHILYSFGANGRKRSRRTHVPATIHPKEKAKPLGSGFQLPGFESHLPGATRINNSHQHARGKGDSRRGDESSNDVQKTLRVAHPRGAREKPGQRSYNKSSNAAYKEGNSRNMSKSIYADDQQQEWMNHVLVNSCLWTNPGQRSHEIMSTHTLQAQGWRSTVALPEKIKAHRECRPGAKSKNSAPYARGTKVIGKADRGARQYPGTSMFQKGLPKNLRVPREPVPQTMGF